MLDLTGVPLVDVHCHPFTRKEHLSADELINVTAFGGGSPQYLEEAGVAVDEPALAFLRAAKTDTVYFRHMIHRLAAYFGVAPDVEAVAAARNAAIERDGYEAYCKAMFTAGEIATLIVDFGYPQPSIPVETFRREAGIEIVPLLRIEPLIMDLLKADLTWGEFRRRYDDTIADALTHGGYRGLKSIIAYRTGLDISPLSRTPDQGLDAHDAIKRGADSGASGGAIKRLRDHLFCRALELCIEHDVPMQVHTGMGDWQVRLTACQPSLLMDLLRFPAYRACRVLLVHTGYPYHAEAGYMANVLPNIWCDLSEGLPFAGSAAKRILAEVLEMAPLSRVCYGSDAYGTPEPFYAAALQGKQAIASALTELVNDGMLSQGEAQTAARLIAGENARSLYQL